MASYPAIVESNGHSGRLHRVYREFGRLTDIGSVSGPEWQSFLLNCICNGTHVR